MSLTLSIGELAIKVTNAQASDLPPWLKPYLAPGKKPLATCWGEYGKIARYGRRILFDSEGAWAVEKTAEGLRLVLKREGAKGKPYQALELSQDLLRGRAVIDPEGLEEEKPFFLREPLLELWYSFLLMHGRGLLLHGCGVKNAQGVKIFLGDSGAGKTTLARLAEKHRVGLVLSDDRLILRPQKKGFFVYGTPWHGEERFSSPRGGRLLSVHFLQKSTRSYLSPLSPRMALEKMLKFCILAGWPRSNLKFSFDLCARVVQSVPCYIFEFRKDESALKVGGLL